MGMIFNSPLGRRVLPEGSGGEKTQFRKNWAQNPYMTFIFKFNSSTFLKNFQKFRKKVEKDREISVGCEKKSFFCNAKKKVCVEKQPLMYFGVVIIQISFFHELFHFLPPDIRNMQNFRSLQPPQNFHTSLHYVPLYSQSNIFTTVFDPIFF